MNIHSLNTDAARAYVPIAGTARANNAGRATKDAEKSESRKASRVDSVVLSDNARDLAAARDAVESTPDVRSEKVAEIKQRVTDGTYSVDARVLARKMLEDSE